MNDIFAIKNYILFLKKECNLSVTLHSYNSNLILKKDLLIFNIHENPYCIYVKSCNAAHNHCIKKQAKIVEKCKNGPFVGTCWAGVQEYVYPVMHDKSVVGFICVSGFSDKKEQEYLLSVAKKYDLTYPLLQTTYTSLKKEMPDKAYVDTLIYPLCNMLELAHIKAEQHIQKDNDTFIRQIIYYIKKNYTKNITSELLCQEFHCSRSHLSKIFNTEMKTTLPEYITKLRIESAKNLLEYSKLDICDIALSVGFNQSYYFTAIFKKHTGVLPSIYRKQHSSKT